jgi:hypothetical protein
LHFYNDSAIIKKIMNNMLNFDFALAWCWEFDRDFAEKIKEISAAEKLSFLEITPGNLEEVKGKLSQGELGFEIFLDRASDIEEGFIQLAQMVKPKPIRMLNNIDQALWSADKATMHLEFLNSGIFVPYTIILSPFEEKPKLELIDLNKLGTPFVMKPACGGGGEGVHLDVKSWEEVEKIRQEYYDDKYLVQQKIIPKNLNGKRAWFRVFYVCGKIFPCFQDDQTKLVEVFLPELEDKLYNQIETTIKKIASISNLDIFSTEVALTSSDKLLVIDHVNDQIDLRKKSKFTDGIPDEVVNQIAFEIVNYSLELLNSKKAKDEKRTIN